MSETKTIAAIGTAATTAGIGMIRISGSQAIPIVDQVFKGKKNKMLADQTSHTIHYGWIYDGEEMIDEVLVLMMKAPHSYTTEDTVEIDCHGGTLVIKKILELLIRHGAEPAEPGEFTKRAFLNGRIDLSQAEAVIDLINSKNDYALKSSVRQLRGHISEKIKQIRKELLYQIAYIESALDDPEHISLDGYQDELDIQLDSTMDEIQRLLSSAEDGRVMSEGIKTVILGKPNVGKSSLMNLLLGEERAIVTDISGTTRDLLEEHLYLRGMSLDLIDTAGIHDTDDIVERIGIAKAKKVVEEADLILCMLDASSELDQNDEKILEMIKEKQVIVLLNKVDLHPIIRKDSFVNPFGYYVMECSVIKQFGIETFVEQIEQMFYQGSIHRNDQIYITNIRHKNLLEKAWNCLKTVKDGIINQLSEDFYSIDLVDAYEQLGKIIGETVEDDIVNEIFSRFCTGK